MDVVPSCDLVIDAAFGTGFHGSYAAPDPNGAMVLAVDIPSGVNGDTGVACDGAMWADHTVTFAALKPGHLLADGPERCGDVELVDRPRCVECDHASRGGHRPRLVVATGLP
jgi:NAD(P)H-hydrate epimerase